MYCAVFKLHLKHHTNQLLTADDRDERGGITGIQYACAMLPQSLLTVQLGELTRQDQVKDVVVSLTTHLKRHTRFL